MARPRKMSLGTINTILNTAPLIIQGTKKLFNLIRERDTQQEPGHDIPASLDGLKDEINRINKRLENGNESDLEQTRLIEELARQNELLALSVKKTGKLLVIISILLVITFALTVYLVAGTMS